jgi:polar amino acid transport system permease protein
MMAIVDHEPRVDLEQISRMPPIGQRRVGDWTMLAVVALLGAMLLSSILTNPGFGWPTVGNYLFHPLIVRGAWVTIQLTVYSMIVGVVLGIVLAVLRISPNRLLRSAASTYIWFFRGTPVLVQLLFWGFIAALYPRIGVGIPWGPEFISWDTNSLIPLFVASVLGLGLNEGAYMAEIVRAGLLSVPPGQSEAAHALGLTHLQTLRRVVLPQALRVIVPPIGNETISMLKTTSLVLVIGAVELTSSAIQIYSRNYQQIPLLIVASIWYLVMTSLMTLGQSWLERRLGRGVATQRSGKK